MRGKAEESHQSFLPCGITPAYAGKSVCFGIVNVRDQGSPPPMRGKVLFFKELERDDRITPAYAGKSVLIVISSPSTKDHPRLCGEKTTRAQRQRTRLGSPPPMRGKVPHSFVHHLSTRITPAYAGKSQDSCCGWVQK